MCIAICNFNSLFVQVMKRQITSWLTTKKVDYYSKYQIKFRFSACLDMCFAICTTISKTIFVHVMKCQITTWPALMIFDTWFLVASTNIDWNFLFSTYLTTAGACNGPCYRSYCETGIWGWESSLETPCTLVAAAPSLGSSLHHLGDAGWSWRWCSCH